MQQVYVVDDGGQWRLDIVGHVGDELGLHALGPGLLPHRPLHAGAQLVHPLAVALEVADQRSGVDALGVISRRQLLAALLQNAQIQGDIQDGKELHQLHHCKDTVHVAVKHLCKEHRQRHQRGFPDQGQPHNRTAQATAHRPEDPPHQPQHPCDQRTPQHRPSLALGCKGAQEQQKHRRQRRAEHGKRQSVENIPSRENRAYQRHQPHIRRDFVQPRQVDALMGRPVSGGGHGEAKAQQRQQQKQHRQEHRQSDVLQQPCHHQIGIAGEFIRRQQVGGDGQLLLRPVGKDERKGSLCGVQRLVAVRQFKVFKGDLSGILVNDRQMAVGVLTGEAFREGAGQIVQHLLLFLVGDAAGRGIRRGIRARRVIRQQAGVGHRASQIVVGVVNGAAAL